MYRLGTIVIFVINLAFANDGPIIRPIIRPGRQDAHKICGLSQSFKGDAIYFVEGRTLPCCRCPDGQVVLEDCLPGEGYMSTTKCGVKPTQSDEATTVVDIEQTTIAVPSSLMTTTTLSAKNDDPDPPDEKEYDTSTSTIVLSIFLAVAVLLAILFFVCWRKDHAELTKINRNNKTGGSDGLLGDDFDIDDLESRNNPEELSV